jgi:hypothetical protein
MAVIRTGVSEELIRVTRIGDLGTTLAATSNRCMSVLKRATRRNIPNDDILRAEPSLRRNSSQRVSVAS